MSKGSKRITIRIGDDLLALVDEMLELRNSQGGSIEEWNRTDWIIKAIEEKLNHAHRSCRRERQVEVIKVDDYQPREVEES